MIQGKEPKLFAWIGFIILTVIILVGIYHAFSRGGSDFAVFHQAWHLVITGRSSEIYKISTDRFLYAPGFAWLLSPLAILPGGLALGFWCLLKVFMMIHLLRKLGQFWWSQKIFFSMGISAWGFVLVARPILIDFEYGQVNLLILGICASGLLSHFDKTKEPSWKTTFLTLFLWSWVGFAAVSKLFPLPLLLVPFVVTRGVNRWKLIYERFGCLLGAGLACFSPIFTVGWSGLWSLLLQWKQAIVARGLPLESHNQSFTALLFHYFSGSPTFIKSEGSHPVMLGYPWLNEGQIFWISIVWSLLVMAIILGWIFYSSKNPPARWISVLLGLLIVPSHLVWKPYFVMGAPLAVWIVNCLAHARDRSLLMLTLIFFVGMNLTGFDFLGHGLGARIEAASILLLMHLLALGQVMLRSKGGRGVEDVL